MLAVLILQGAEEEITVGIYNAKLLILIGVLGCFRGGNIEYFFL